MFSSALLSVSGPIRQHVDLTVKSWFCYCQIGKFCLTQTNYQTYFFLFLKKSVIIVERQHQGDELTSFSFSFFFTKDIFPYPYLIDYTGIHMSYFIFVCTLAINAHREMSKHIELGNELACLNACV